MNFIANLNSGSFTSIMARAKNIQNVSIAGLDFSWNGRQYRTKILSEIPASARNHPQINIATLGHIPTTPSLPNLIKDFEVEVFEKSLKIEKNPGEVQEISSTKAGPGRPRKVV